MENLFTVLAQALDLIVPLTHHLAPFLEVARPFEGGINVSSLAGFGTTFTLIFTRQFRDDRRKTA